MISERSFTSAICDVCMRAIGPKMAMLFIIIFFCIDSVAETQIAFIEIRDRHGNIHQLEPGGRFSHIAISYKGRWLHAHPYRGVEIVSLTDLEKIGSLTLVSLPSYPELTLDEIKKYLDKPYDSGFSWDGDSFYCSKLVGKILGLDPEPMNFRAGVWRDTKPKGSLGLSPDDIFRKIMSMDYRPRCESAF